MCPPAMRTAVGRALRARVAKTIAGSEDGLVVGAREGRVGAFLSDRSPRALLPCLAMTRAIRFAYRDASDTREMHRDLMGEVIVRSGD